MSFINRKPLTTIYEPGRFTKLNRLALWKEMLQELTTSRELGHRLFLRDLSAKYRQSVLGLFWIVFAPFYTTIVFFGLKRAGILHVADTGVPYPIYVLMGTTIWSLFSGLVTSLALSVNASGNLIGKINFPRIALVHSPIITSFIDFFIRAVLVLAGMSLSGFPPSLTGLLLLPLTLLPLVLFSIGIGLFLSLIGAVIKDIGSAIDLVLNLLLYMAPILYTMPKSGILQLISRYNPVYLMVSIPRDLVFYGTTENANIYLIYALLSIVVFLSGWRFYHVSLSRIVEKI